MARALSSEPALVELTSIEPLLSLWGPEPSSLHVLLLSEHTLDRIVGSIFVGRICMFSMHTTPWLGLSPSTHHVSQQSVFLQHDLDKYAPNLCACNFLPNMVGYISENVCRHTHHLDKHRLRNVIHPTVFLDSLDYT